MTTLLRLIRCLILGLFLTGTSLWPTFASPQAGLPTLEEFDWKLADDPWGTFKWAKARFETLPKDVDLATQIRVTNYFMATAAQTQELDLVAQHLQRIEEYWRKAEELSLIRDRVSLGFSLAMYYRVQNQVALSDTLYKQVIEEARRYHDDECLIQILSAYGQALDVGAEQTQALQYLQEAQSMAADPNRNIHPLHRHVASMTAALQLYEYGDANLNRVVDHSMEYFLEVRPRFVLAIFSFNIGRLFFKSDEERAIRYYEIALKEARSIDDRSTMGSVLAELAMIDNGKGRYLEAEKKAAEAIQVIGFTDKHWRGRALAEQAHSLWKLNRSQEALSVSTESLGLISPANLRRLEWIHEIRASIQEELGLYKDAILSHKKVKEIRARRQDEAEEETFAKAKVQLGLQMESQKNLLLSKENELQAARLKTARYLAIAALALGVLLIGAIVSTVWAIANARRIRRAKEKIQIILDVIEEGILTINSQLRPEPEYSRYLQQLYPDLFKDAADAIDSLFPDSVIGSENQSIIRETLRACLGEEILAWNLNSGQLPTEMILPGPVPRHILVLWQPLFDVDAKIRGFLLSFRDISEQKNLQKEVRVQQQKAETLEQRVQELLLTRFPDATRLLDRLNVQLREDWTQSSFKRELHTRKGEARTLGLKGLSQMIHQLESTLESSSSEAKSQAVEQLQQVVESYRTLMRDVFAGQSIAASAPTTLVETVGPLLPALKQQLADGQIPLQTIEVSDSVREWPQAILDAVRQNLLHALANSADHGYILPQRRGQSLPAAFFRIEALESKEGIEVRVRDFGVGLDLIRLEQLAKQRDFQPTAAETIADVVFLDGLSTAEQTSTTSGRGVGLSAVRELCQRFHGHAYLRPNDQGRGSMLVMNFHLASQAA